MLAHIAPAVHVYGIAVTDVVIAIDRKARICQIVHEFVVTVDIFRKTVGNLQRCAYRAFGLTDADFINIGFGKDKEVLRRTRNSLIEKKMVFFKKGGVGKKSQYKLNRKKNGKN